MTGKQPFSFRKQAAGFGDVTRWLKDAGGTVRGLVFWLFVALATYGALAGWRAITGSDRRAPAAPVTVSGPVSGGRIQNNAQISTKTTNFNLPLANFLSGIFSSKQQGSEAE